MNKDKLISATKINNIIDQAITNLGKIKGERQATATEILEKVRKRILGEVEDVDR